MDSSPQGACRARSGFSLVELLTVIAIFAVLAAFTVPAFNAMAGSQRMSRAIGEVTGMLEFAKSEAMARKTYVWVGFKNLPASDAANRSGTHELVMAVFASPDGSATAQPVQLSRVIRLSHVSLVPGFGGGQLSEALQARLDAMDSQFYKSGDPAWKNRHMPPNPLALFGATKTLPSVAGVGFEKSITFTPQGEAMLVPEPTTLDGFENIIDVGLKRMRGDSPDTSSPDDAVVWLYGATGRHQVLRLQ